MESKERRKYLSELQKGKLYNAYLKGPAELGRERKNVEIDMKKVIPKSSWSDLKTWFKGLQETNNAKPLNLKNLSDVKKREQVPKYSYINDKIMRDYVELRHFGFVAQGPGLQYMAM